MTQAEFNRSPIADSYFVLETSEFDCTDFFSHCSAHLLAETAFEYDRFQISQYFLTFQEAIDYITLNGLKPHSERIGMDKDGNHIFHVFGFRVVAIDPDSCGCVLESFADC